jgi:hypothetical protein
VLSSFIPQKVVVQTIDDSYQMLRMLPYHHTENQMKGVVINFIHITDHKQAKLSLNKAKDELRLATVGGVILMMPFYYNIWIEILWYGMPRHKTVWLG